MRGKIFQKGQRVILFMLKFLKCLDPLQKVSKQSNSDHAKCYIKNLLTAVAPRH